MKHSALWLKVSLLALLLLVACGGGGGETTAVEPSGGESLVSEEAGAVAETAVDAETGLPFNPPNPRELAEFVVEGEVTSVRQIPIESPEFVVVSESGNQYTITAQPLNQIAFDDGTTLQPHEYGKGMVVRAVVMFDQEMEFGVGGFFTENMVILSR